MRKKQNNKHKIETKLSGHKRDKKILTPPFLQIPNFHKSSWIDDRLPEMLWAVLIIGNINRKESLGFFRYVAEYVKSNPKCRNITLSGISNLSKKERDQFIKHMCSYSPKTKNILRAMLIFKKLPAFNSWQIFLDKPIEKEDWNKIGDGVSKTFSHQSQEATDCRWIKVFAQLLGGKLKFVRKGKNKEGPGLSEEAIDYNLRGLYEYPNYGDMRRMRPFIRATEIAPIFGTEKGTKKWSEAFWSYCFYHTGCIPEHVINKKIEKRKQKLSEDSEKTRKHYTNETIRLRNALIDHAIKTSKKSSIDARHETAFGLALYSLTLFIEIIFYRATLSITGRLALRALVETNIVFAFLLKKESKEAGVWEDYRGYGTGQIKLIYLKLQELSNIPKTIDFYELNYMANEDAWVEFTPINLGHWGSSNLRKMSEEVGLKELYDKYYDYTSGYMHASWGAVRESVYQKCVNPLHRYHRIPVFDLPLLPSVLDDSEKIINQILGYLSSAYPKFNDKIHSPKTNNKAK